MNNVFHESIAMAGKDSPESWKFREELIKNSEFLYAIYSIQGMWSEQAWGIRTQAIELARKRWKETKKDAARAHYLDVLKYAARGLIGIDSPEADKLRLELFGRAQIGDALYYNFPLIEAVIDSTKGIDSEKAWEIRRKFKFGIPDYCMPPDRGDLYIPILGVVHSSLRSITGLNSQPAWELRNSILEAFRPGEFKSREIRESVAESLAGLSSPESWEMRDKLRKMESNDGTMSYEFILSLTGLDDEIAWNWREEYLKEGKALWALDASLTGFDSSRVWELRKTLARQPKDESVAKHLIKSLAGIDTDVAWAVRNLIFETHKSSWHDQEHSVYEELRESIKDLDSESANSLRGQVESAIACKLLKIFEGGDSAHAWTIREDALAKFPPDSTHRSQILEAVAKSLRGRSTRKAWDMRVAIANEERERHGCLSKETILGLYRIDDEEAWRWRNEYLQQGQDLWVLIDSLEWLYSSEAWQMREKLAQIPERTLAMHLLEDMKYMDSLEAWQVRLLIIETHQNSNKERTQIYDSLLESIKSCDSIAAKLMQKYLAGLRTTK